MLIIIVLLYHCGLYWGRVTNRKYARLVYYLCVRFLQSIHHMGEEQGARSSKDGPVEVLGLSLADERVAVPTDASTFYENEKVAAPSGASAVSVEQVTASSDARQNCMWVLLLLSTK